MKTKICTICKKRKYLEKFHRAKDGKFGRKSYCKACYSEKIEILCCDCEQKCLKARFEYRRRPRCTKCSKKLVSKLASERMKASTGSKNPNWKGGVSKDNMRYRRRQLERWPEKEKARSALKYQVRRGNIKKEPCEVCGAEKDIHGHHDDYSKPLEVRWLCRKHHREVHGGRH